MNYTRKTAATLQPVDISVLAEHCRISGTDQDAVLQVYSDAAVDWVEQYTGRALLTQTWQLSLPAFPTAVWLPFAAPLGAVSFVKYYDADNALQTLSSSVYTVPVFAEPAYVTLASGQSWPSIYWRDDAVQLEYTAGWTTPEAVPAALRQAVQLLAGHFYANREGVLVGAMSKEIEFAVTALCAPYRIFVRPPC